MMVEIYFNDEPSAGHVEISIIGAVKDNLGTCLTYDRHLIFYFILFFIFYFIFFFFFSGVAYNIGGLVNYSIEACVQWLCELRRGNL
ncbi:hypothetical protein CC78DRAFT_57413 [Lojkania enalia]|uniref:Uncharacterized protein n=1 Tax=Lojkania enalia TaxID=147567 RepID=A0A9P4N295_9PLEO|nr:hypothetical protein CC78DRAFT_57413 [Didymosphaeria enalia]